MPHLAGECYTATSAVSSRPIRSPLTGLRGAFWMKASRWARIGSGRTCPTPRIVPIKASWRGSIRKRQVVAASARQTRHAKLGDGPEARRIGPCPRPDGRFRQPFSSSVAPRRMREPAGRCQSREICVLGNWTRRNTRSAAALMSFFWRK